MHLDAYLEPCPGYGWEGTPRFRTNIVPLDNGDEFRNGDWIEARHEFVAPFENIEVAAARLIRKMFYVARGMLHAFRLVDEIDHDATDEVFGAGDGTTTLFQLNKISEVDGATYTRNVYALPAVPVLKVNGVATTDFDVNLRTGQVRFDVAPAAAAQLTWSGAFDIWVRFATDTIPQAIDDLDAVNGQVTLIEVPPPRAEVWT